MRCVWGPGAGIPSETLGLPGGQANQSTLLAHLVSSGPTPFSPTCRAGLAAEDSVYEKVAQKAEDTGSIFHAWLLPEQVTLRDNRETRGERAGRSLITPVPGGC